MEPVRVKPPIRMRPKAWSNTLSLDQARQRRSRQPTTYGEYPTQS